MGPKPFTESQTRRGEREWVKPRNRWLAHEESNVIVCVTWKERRIDRFLAFLGNWLQLSFILLHLLFLGALNNALWILLVYFTYNSKLGKQQIASSRVVVLAKAIWCFRSSIQIAWWFHSRVSKQFLFFGMNMVIIKNKLIDGK